MRYVVGFVLVMALGALGCGDGEAGCAEPVADPGGTWCMTATNIENSCTGELYDPHDFFFTIFQEGSDLSAASNWGWLEGTICGDQIRMSGEGGRDDLTVTGNMELTISADGNSVEGSEAWTATRPDLNCRGRDLLSGYRC